MVQEHTIQRFLEGNVQAFKDIYEQFWPRVLSVCERYIHDREDAVDLTQEIFYTLWNRRELLKSDVNLSAYLHQAAKNQCFNYIRNRQRLLDRQSDYRPEQVSSFSTEDIQYKEFVRVCNLSISRIDEPSRTIFHMSRNEHLTHREIAETLDISVKMVEYHIGKVLKKLRRSLHEYL